MLKNRLEFFFFYLFRSFILLLPIKIRYMLADAIGILTFYVIKRRRSITFRNLKLAFPKKKHEEIRKIAINSYKNISRTFIETFWINELKSNLVGSENITKALSNNKGLICITLHLGNWELAGSVIAKNGFPIFAVAKPQRNVILNKEVNFVREKSGMKIISTKDPQFLKNAIKAFKTNSVLALLSDQYENDVSITFFSAKTKAPSGVAVLALKFKVPVVFGYSVRNADNTHTIYIEEEFNIINTGNVNQDKITNTQNFMDKMEDIIRKYPDQWLWQHQRWRRFQ